jgi:hypothetical protein
VRVSWIFTLSATPGDRPKKQWKCILTWCATDSVDGSLLGGEEFVQQPLGSRENLPQNTDYQHMSTVELQWFAYNSRGLAGDRPVDRDDHFLRKDDHVLTDGSPS